MLLIDTTCGWNLGDDLIREGVCRLLGIRPDMPVYWLNRATLSKGYLCEVLANRIQLGTDNAKAIYVCAGTPAWFEGMELIRPYLDRYRPRTILVGVGGVARSRTLSLLASLPIIGCTTREHRTQAQLQALTQCHMYWDPAFHANYATSPTKTCDIVLNYRCKDLSPPAVAGAARCYGQLFSDFKSRIDLVTVHEPWEYNEACRQFGASRVFYSSDYGAYKGVYAQFRHYIGGRIHGAIPAVAQGATADLLYGHPKVAAVTPSDVPITVHTYDQSPVVPAFAPPLHIGAQLAAQFKSHADYLVAARELILDVYGGA